ncbi:MAG: redoxin domain-containing protein [Mesorhizobium sp.]|nr:MAG: redoxin domain-containing protein [Mesorhizobium sp.]
MMIAVGDKLPQATFKTMTADSAKAITTAEIFSGKKVVLFAVPGAFTPTCSNNHLPGFLDNYDAILARGVDTIAVVAVNDVHVMGAWARFSGGGMGLRSKRFSMIVDDGKVAALNVETKPGVDESGAAHILGQLSVLATA